MKGLSYWLMGVGERAAADRRAGDPAQTAPGWIERGGASVQGSGAGFPLTVGNAAKLYCLGLIDQVADGGRPLLLLDFGCGDGRHFVALLRRRSNLRYVGVDPSARACERARTVLAGLGDVVCSPAYDLRLGPAQVVTSFSVFEHVYQRARYLECVRANLAADGVAFVNYDAGHFTPAATLLGRVRQRCKAPIRRALASVGFEQFYQARVRDAQFKKEIADAGLRLLDEKFFNTDLKTVYRLVADTDRGAFMDRWLELELYLNKAGIRYQDGLAGLFRTRNFVLARADASTSVLGGF